VRSLRSVRTATRAVYLVLSLGLGIAWFTILAVAFTTGVGLLVTLVGIPVLVGAVWITRPMADLERALVGALLGARTEGHYRRPSRDGVWPAVTARIAEAQTWKDVAYLLCQLPLGVLWFTLTALAIGVPLWLLLAPVYYWALPNGIQLGLFDADTLPEAVALVPAGALLVVPARYAIDGMGIAHAAWARLLLHSEPDPELAAKVVDARSAQARIIEAADAERRRIERDLHDGAQQRLVALSLKLGMARTRMEDADGAAVRLVDEAHAESKAALAELRDLARGIHPAILTDHGLGAALHELAGRTPVPTAVAEAPDDRLPPAVETAAYFVVAECLANVAKYAQAGSATVRVRREVGRLVVEIIDDGVGGADPRRGSGLRGLTDRVGALDGTLDVASPPGEGTRVRAEIPLGQPAGRELESGGGARPPA
jgi:signal transduction histidine kinase